MFWSQRSVVNFGSQHGKFGEIAITLFIKPLNYISIVQMK